MKVKALLALAVFFSVSLCSVLSDHWALLVAGSNGYFNYRHQADICHAYHIVRSHGIPDERIVVMMYDDIANNSQNPFPGNIINHPDGPNLYPGVLKDYTGEEVTPEVFLKVLSGDEKGVEKLLGRKGKVIKSGPTDNIFVNFADHGAPGLIAFPSEFLYADDFNKVILEMHSNAQYKEMVIYVEACESGSFFNSTLRKDINVFATTAANPHQSSYACYYDDKRQTYLGDVYSVKWMEDSEVENLGKETLKRQFRIVKKETNTSHVMEYGDLSMRKKKVGDFQGNISDKTLIFRQKKKYNPNIGAVPSEDVVLEILKRKAAATNGLEKMQHQSAIKALLRRKMDSRNFFKQIVRFVTNSDYNEMLQTRLHFTDFKCYRESLRIIKAMCPGLELIQNDYALRNLRALANLCETDVPKERIWSAIEQVIPTSPLCKAHKTF